MLRVLSVLFLLVLTLSALSDKEILKRANSFINASKKSDQFRAYNDFKHLYLRALISEDTTLKHSALVGIVKSGSKLHIDISHYKKELASTAQKNIKKERVFKAKSSLVSSKYQAVTSPRGVRNKIIVIDAGHGGKDPGAIGYKNYKEKVVVLQIAKRLKKILHARGYTVYMTRDSDKFIKLRNRTRFANKKNADLFISIHANAVGKKSAKKAYGLECYFLDKSRSSRAKRVSASENKADLKDMNFYGKESFLNTLNTHNIVAANKLAIDLQRSALGTLSKHFKNVKDAGVRSGPFWVLVGAQMPAVLVEVGFITHPREARRLVNSKYQDSMAIGFANGIERYFQNN